MTSSSVKKTKQKPQKREKRTRWEFEQNQRHNNTKDISSRTNNVGNTRQRETRQFLRVVLFLVVCPFVLFFVCLFVCLGDEDAKRVLLV